MKRISNILALAILMLAIATSAQAEGAASGNPGSIAVEIENQTPCFLFGGYQLSVGVRYGRFRIRASTQDSGTADFEDNGIDDRDERFSRAYDDGSFSVTVDYFLNDYFFGYACLASNRWLVEDKDNSAGDHLRTLDAGLGLGLQYVFYKGLFIQLTGQVNFRERQSLIIQSRKYTVPGIDYSPGLRLGYQFR
ncbi:MAG: hypothetical protein A2Z99_16945 [Treponema sp. GWB1_62_6]|nr:MAG: hypothetical protein A2Z99_16945 [Treponema sp. GWB1_62_6]